MRVVADHRNAPLSRRARDTLHHQHIVHAEHVNAVAQPRRGVAAVYQYIVAVVERRRHRIAFDANDAERARIGAEVAQPFGIEGDLALDRFAVDACHRTPPCAARQLTSDERRGGNGWDRPWLSRGWADD